LDNFNAVQDPKTGGYSVLFNQNKKWLMSKFIWIVGGWGEGVEEKKQSNWFE
jgi:hypothetical protein